MGRPCRHANRHRFLSSSPTSRRRAPTGGCRSPSRTWRWCAPTGRSAAALPRSTCRSSTSGADRRALSRALRPSRPSLAVVRAPAAVRCRSADAARPAGSRTACRPPRRRPGRLLRTGRRRARLLRPDAPLHRPAYRPVAARPRHRARLRPRHRADRPQHQHARPSQGARHLSQGRVSPGAQREQGIARSARAVAGGLSLAAGVTRFSSPQRASHCGRLRVLSRLRF